MAAKSLLTQLPFGRNFLLLKFKTISSTTNTIRQLAIQSASLNTSVIGISQSNFAKKYSSEASSAPTIPIVSYEEIKHLPKQPEKMLIDVREPKELEETGQIPTSINIPLGQVAEALAPNVDAGTFKAKYGRDKPQKNTELIFHCRIGRRSQSAAEIAKGLGYENSKNYLGSWLEWAEKEGLPK